MKITVITVCLNSVCTIEKTIKSVIEQTGCETEYIIVDGASNDGTLEIIERYGAFIDRWITEPDNGIFDAMNKGIEMATGDVIAFLNSDDWYEEKALKIVSDAFKNYDCDCVCCGNYVRKKDGITVYYDVSNKNIEELFIHMIYYHSAIFCRKDFFSKKHNFDLRYKIAADYDWFLKAVKRGLRIKNINSPVFTFNYGGISSVNEIECASEARQIAFAHLSADSKEYRDAINERFYEVAISAADNSVLYKELIKILGENNTNVLWGAGVRGRQCVKWFNRIGIVVEKVIDSNRTFWGKCIDNTVVCTPDILKNISGNLIVTPDRHTEEIRNIILNFKNEDIRIFDLKSLCGTLAEAISEGNKRGVHSE